ncbi:MULTISPECIES: alpha-(1-_3)-arabinofuranosyltransferase domain-containing protein [unclassified Nocardioides]|uniref:alpha-(1->3)-arabinofuranosyltransferase domain-containing protein n=1 Tax=unclassified Nocardioides TaxID=2615069 RepID=UPI0018860122|nr:MULTISPECIES: alpha-(1->3)-arabinofuranosyltransferase family protein [unclassified Nocardioides]
MLASLVFLVFMEKFGRTTTDTRLDLTDAPGTFLRDALSLWNPRVSMGELQNQAYGYLFPQGLFFWAGELAQVPGWVVERTWSALLLVVAAEGVRRLALAMSLGPWAAMVAGLAYALTPRHVTEIGVRSAEILAGAVLPWALLPIVLVILGRIRPWQAAVLSPAAYLFAGGVNGTVTFYPTILLGIVVLWAWATRRVRWTFVLGWGSVMVLANLWWAVSLLRLGVYSPPFYDFVEAASTTTDTAGMASALRGTSNWVPYVVINRQAWWPSGWDLLTDPVLVVATGFLALAGLLGLVRMNHAFRTPLLISVVVGLVAITVSHDGLLSPPFAGMVRDLLDGSLAPLRNVAKADPILRVPLALGLGALLAEVIAVLLRPGRGARRRRRLHAARRVSAGVLAAAMAGSLAAAAWPVVNGNTRTPGWTEFPSYWQEALAHLDEDDRDGVVWVVPGSGFGIQDWGWTMEEPIQVTGTSRWVTRSQVPLTPAATIRMLSRLEGYLTTGSGSPFLRDMLGRIGVDRILLRHDLDQSVAQSSPSSVVSQALARSPGIERVALFGSLDFGPAIEVFEVRGDESADRVRIRDTADAVTVASSVEDVIDAVGAGLVTGRQAAVVAGQPGWDRRVDVQGDALRLRERAFGRVNDAESNVMTPEEPYRGERVVPNYPVPDGAEPVVARYSGIAGVRSSSSTAYVDTLGVVRPETAPWAVLDGNPDTYWLSQPYVGSEGQWVEVELERPRRVGRVVLRHPVTPIGIRHPERWKVTAGDVERIVTPDPLTGVGRVDFGEHRASSVRVTALDTPDATASIGLAELEIGGLRAERTMVVPPVDLDARADFVFGTQPETRTCFTTLLGPDCDVYRARPSEEATGIDRTLTVRKAGEWRLGATAIAASGPASANLLTPFLGVQVAASSFLGSDPAVSPRMVHDGEPTTSWISDPRDPRPELRLDLGRERRVDTLDISSSGELVTRPRRAVLVGDDGERRTVDLGSSIRVARGFAPMRTSTLRIIFERAEGAVRPIGISELSLGDVPVTVPMDGSTVTGAACGFGPTLVVDGESYPTRVRGAMGAVYGNGLLAVEPCGKRQRIRLDAGTHRVELRSSAQFQPIQMRLEAVEETAEPRASRKVEMLSAERTEMAMRVSDGEEAILSLPQSTNIGWVARAGDRVLDPIEVDGWAQGWIVPADVSGDITVTFDPQDSYFRNLVLGLGVAAAVLLAGMVALVQVLRRRREPGAAPETEPELPGSERPVASWYAASAVLAVGLIAFVLGPLVAAGAALGVLLRRRTVAFEVLGLVLIGAGLVVAVAASTGSSPGTPPAADLLTGAGAGVVLAGALAGTRPAYHRGRRRATARPVAQR